MSKTTIKQAIDGFLLNCKVEGKSWGTIDCYRDKLKGFLWYATNYDWSDDKGSQINTVPIQPLDKTGAIRNRAASTTSGNVKMLHRKR